MNSILRAWCQMQQRLVKHTSETLRIEWTRQPLFWNPRVRTSDNVMIGELEGMAWGTLAHTWLHSIGDWRHTMTPGGSREDPVSPLKGAKKMRRLIATTVDMV